MQLLPARHAQQVSNNCMIGAQWEGAQWEGAQWEGARWEGRAVGGARSGRGAQ